MPTLNIFLQLLKLSKCWQDNTFVKRLSFQCLKIKCDLHFFELIKIKDKSSLIFNIQRVFKEYIKYEANDSDPLSRTEAKFGLYYEVQGSNQVDSMYFSSLNLKMSLKKFSICVLTRKMAIFRKWSKNQSFSILKPCGLVIWAILRLFLLYTFFDKSTPFWITALRKFWKS